MFLEHSNFQTTTSLSYALTCIQENWVSVANAGSSYDERYELYHRRQLVEKWASATQEFRDVNSTRSKSPKSIELTNFFFLPLFRRTNRVHLWVFQVQRGQDRI